ncbi:MAG TPA: hypothetical protein PK513_05945 [Alphaproteobacteria bacterium]|nr:hypothetical protein [Alphaproteobacteria bacterium]USO05854.1 MAG: hypothetical protein H6859_01225 [Rhodospirillales bacterium]HOO82024.1 hypothetical protein [Alphaproteobacteria bacterium]
MFGSQYLQIKPEKVLQRLKDFELFCLGEKNLSPEMFKGLNEDLSLSAILHIGKRHFRRDIDGNHLIWQGLDKREHDLGPIDDLKITQACPGYHKARTLALAGDDVLGSDIVNIPTHKRQVVIVKMKDGTSGVGPNYKMALRNAALKMHLKYAFERTNRSDIWKQYYGNC